MTPRRLLYLLVLCAAPGCTWIPYAVENLAEAPLDMWDRVCLRSRFRKEAAAAWDHVVKNSPGVAYSDFYACGFREGFVEFLDADGTGDPPAAPPWSYRRRNFLTAEGKQQVEDWFGGYRHGAAVARASGLRWTVVVPLALPPLNTTLGDPEIPQPAAPAEVPPEALPAPRPLPVKPDPEAQAAGKQ